MARAGQYDILTYVDCAGGGAGQDNGLPRGALAKDQKDIACVRGRVGNFARAVSRLIRRPRGQPRGYRRQLTD